MFYQRQAATSHRHHWRWSASVVVGGDLALLSLAVIYQWRCWRWSAGGVEMASLVMIYQRRRRQWYASGRLWPVSGVIGVDIDMSVLTLTSVVVGGDLPPASRWCHWWWCTSGVVGNVVPAAGCDQPSASLAVICQCHSQWWSASGVVDNDLLALSLKGWSSSVVQMHSTWSSKGLCQMHPAWPKITRPNALGVK